MKPSLSHLAKLSHSTLASVVRLELNEGPEISLNFHIMNVELPPQIASKLSLSPLKVMLAELEDDLLLLVNSMNAFFTTADELNSTPVNLQELTPNQHFNNCT